MLKLIKSLLILSTALFFIFLILSITKLIKVGEIKCFSQYGICAKSVMESLDQIDKTNLKDTEGKLNSQLKNNIFIKEYSIHFILPNKLIVNIIEKSPKFAIKNSKIDAFALVDNKGQVLAIEKNTSLPFIIVEDKLPNKGEYVSNNQLFSLDLLANIQSNYKVQGEKWKIILC